MLHPLKTKCPNDFPERFSSEQRRPPPAPDSLHPLRIGAPSAVGPPSPRTGNRSVNACACPGHPGHLSFWADCHLAPGGFLMVCLFLDQVGESWTEAGYCPTSSSCPAGPIKTSRPSGPAAAATSFSMAASVDRTLPGPAGRLNGLPLAVPLSVFTLVLDWILSWRLSGCPVSRPPGCPHTAWSRRVPSGALGDQKGSWNANPRRGHHLPRPCGSHWPPACPQAAAAGADRWLWGRGLELGAWRPSPGFT